MTDNRNTTEPPVDSTAVRWAALLVYCAMAPFVLVGGLLADLFGFMVRVMQPVCDAFGWNDPAIPEIATRMVLAGIFIVICFLMAST